MAIIKAGYTFISMTNLMDHCLYSCCVLRTSRWTRVTFIQVCVLHQSKTAEGPDEADILDQNEQISGIATAFKHYALTAFGHSAFSHTIAR